MEAARGALEALGHHVAGGFLSPSHDSYVRPKLGAEALPARHRLSLCEALCLGSGFAVDPWECLSVPAAINFTDVFRRLESVLASASEASPEFLPLRPVYAFGGDNAWFSEAFLERGMAVCVGRPGRGEAFSAAASDAGVMASGRTLFVSSPFVEDRSSTSVRSGAASLSNRLAKVAFFGWRSPDAPAPEDLSGASYFLRDDRAHCLSPWVAKLGREAPSSGRDPVAVLAAARVASDAFVESVGEALRSAFSGARAPDSAVSIPLAMADVDRQRIALAEEAAGSRILSLDAVVGGDAVLGLSRAFLLSDGQRAAVGRVARPGSLSPETQVSAIPPGEWVLAEDDVATGGSLSAALSLLPASIKVMRVIVLSELSGAEKTFDALDLRDFLVGSADGGLVVLDASLSNEPVRCPYLPPYVSLRSRARLPPSSEGRFGVAVWRANERFFHSLSAHASLLIGDGDPAFVRFAEALGFASSMPLAEFCAWHAERAEDESSWER
jgi:hypothetical protein